MPGGILQPPHTLGHSSALHESITCKHIPVKRTIETTGTVDAEGRLHLDAPVSALGAGPVRVLLLFEGEAHDLRARGINADVAAELRARLAPFAEDWNSPEMAIYDDYDAHI